eukprot:scaffold33355_cov146-Isochrysis_galbana.AAC.1
MGRPRGMGRGKLRRWWCRLLLSKPQWMVAHSAAPAQASTPHAPCCGCPTAPSSASTSRRQRPSSRRQWLEAP